MGDAIGIVFGCFWCFSPTSFESAWVSQGEVSIKWTYNDLYGSKFNLQLATQGRGEKKWERDLSSVVDADVWHKTMVLIIYCLRKLILVPSCEAVLQLFLLHLLEAKSSSTKRLWIPHGHLQLNAFLLSFLVKIVQAKAFLRKDDHRSKTHLMSMSHVYQMGGWWLLMFEMISKCYGQLNIPRLVMVLGTLLFGLTTSTVHEDSFEQFNECPFKLVMFQTSSASLSDLWIGPACWSVWDPLVHQHQNHANQLQPTWCRFTSVGPWWSLVQFH